MLFEIARFGALLATGWAGGHLDEQNKQTQYVYVDNKRLCLMILLN